MLRKSELWAKRKLEEMKHNWKEACEKILHLQGELEERESELFNLRRHESHTQRFISHMQSEFRKLNTQKDSSTELQDTNSRLSHALSDLQLQKEDMRRLLEEKGSFILELESILSHKDQELHQTKLECSKLKDKYRKLRGHRRLNQQLVQEERLLTAAERFREKYGGERALGQVPDQKLSELLKKSTESLISNHSSDNDSPHGVSPPHVHHKPTQRWRITPNRERQTPDQDTL